RRISRFMRVCLRFRVCRRLWAGLDSRFGVGFLLALGFVNRADHVERALRIVLELIVQDALAAVQRVLEADELSLEAGELLRREEGLGEETLQPAGADDHLAVLRRQ